MALVRQIWEFLQDQLEHSEKGELTVGKFVISANETTIAGFWREHAEEIHGQVILRGKHYLRSVCRRSLEYVNQPVGSLVSGVSQILVQHGSCLDVQ